MMKNKIKLSKKFFPAIEILLFFIVPPIIAFFIPEKYLISFLKYIFIFEFAFFYTLLRK